MKKRLCILLALLLTVAACNKNSGGDSPVNVPAALALSDDRIVDGDFTTDAAASVEHIGVRTNLADWSAEVISDGAGWLTAEPLREPAAPETGVEVTQKLRLTIYKNTETAARSAIVRISGRDIERSFKVVQGQAGYILSFDSPRHARAAGEDIDVAITANAEYTLTIPGEYPWIEDITAQTEGLAADTRRLRVARNDATGPRTATLEVAVKDMPEVKKALVVEQQGGEPSIDIDGENPLEVPWDKTEVTLRVTANVAYRIDFDYGDGSREWIWRVAPRGMEARDEKFSLNVNITNQPRTVVIRFFSDDPAASPAITKDITLTQGAYTLPPEDVFSLVTPPGGIMSLPASRVFVRVEVKTGRDHGDIDVAVPDWVTHPDEPIRSRDILTYEFEVGENPWPLRRNNTITFSSRGEVINIKVEQEAGERYASWTDYSSVEGLDDDFRKLSDYNLGTYVLSRPGALPQQWKFALKNPADNIFNCVMYHPVMDDAAGCGIKDYEIWACPAATGTYYTVASGSIPESFYRDAAGLRKGYAINIPNMENARYLVLKVNGTHIPGGTFGASELHFVYDGFQNITNTPRMELTGEPPFTVACDDDDLRVGISANTPYEMLTDDGHGGAPDWLTYNAAASTATELCFSISPNSGGERSAEVTLRATRPGVDISRRFTVVQEATDAELAVRVPASGVFNLPASGILAAGQDIAIELTTNLTLSQLMVGALPGWITLEDKSDYGNGTVRFDLLVAENRGGSRDHTVTFSGRGKEVAVTINQAAKPDLVPTLSVRSPNPPVVDFNAAPAPDTFEVVLETNIGYRDISVGMPAWLGNVSVVQGDGIVTYTFGIDANTGGDREAHITFSATGAADVSVTVRQGKLNLPGVRVAPDRAFYYDDALNQFDASETIDGNRSTFHTAPSNDFYAYEFQFPNSTDLSSLIYYPRDSATAHGAFRRIKVLVVCRDGGVGVDAFEVNIPESVYTTEAGRRAGWRIDLPHKAERVSHLRIIAIEGYQDEYSAAEVEFFAPRI